jgi:hypothetical protein
MNTWRIEALVPTRADCTRCKWVEIDSEAVEAAAHEMARRYRDSNAYLKIRVVTGKRRQAYS